MVLLAATVWFWCLHHQAIAGSNQVPDYKATASHAEAARREHMADGLACTEDGRIRTWRCSSGEPGGRRAYLCAMVMLRLNLGRSEMLQYQ